VHCQIVTIERIDRRLGDPMSSLTEDAMKQSEHFLENAENSAQLAERASDEPTRHRYKRMEAAWRALAVEQDWLDGVVSQNGKSGR
jgi:hypothetical protein